VGLTFRESVGRAGGPHVAPAGRRPTVSEPRRSTSTDPSGTLRYNHGQDYRKGEARQQEPCADSSRFSKSIHRIVYRRRFHGKITECMESRKQIIF